MPIKTISNFITHAEQLEILKFVNNYSSNNVIDNIHIKEISKHINGFAIMCDTGMTDISRYVSSFQSDENLEQNIPEIFYTIQSRIANALNIPKDNTFLQILKMNSGGEIKAHYDATYPNYITYKCNVCVKGESDYIINVEKEKENVKELSLYAFEANLYKHWVEPYHNERVLLSYGFVLQPEVLGYTTEHPRIRLANRMFKYYQNEKGAD